MIASARAARASSGAISGSGLASAKRIGFALMLLTICEVKAPLTDRPTATSAPLNASSSVRSW